MAVRLRSGAFHLIFRPFKDKQVSLKLEVRTKTEARQVETMITHACRTGNYSILDGEAREACIRMFENQLWEFPSDLGGAPVVQSPKRILTLWDAAKLFMQTPEVRAKTAKAISSYEGSLVHLAEVFGPNIPLKDLWIPDLKRYQFQLLNEGAAPSTINIELSALSRLFAVMIEHRLLEVNPVRLPKRLSTRSNERQVYLSRETVEEIAGECPAWFQRIVWAAFFSGMRKGEILGMTRRQVDLKKRMIYLAPEDTKEKRRKRVPIHHELVPIIEEAIRTPYLASDRVFLVQDAKGIRVPGTDSAGNPWARACEALGLEHPRPRFHDLRHTWRTNARRSGVDYQVAESIMGHWFKAKSVNVATGILMIRS